MAQIPEGHPDLCRNPFHRHRIPACLVLYVVEKANFLNSYSLSLSVIEFNTIIWLTLHLYTAAHRQCRTGDSTSTHLHYFQLQTSALLRHYVLYSSVSLLLHQFL